MKNSFENLFNTWNMEEQNHNWNKNWQMAMNFNKHLLEYSMKVMNHQMHSLNSMVHNCAETCSNMMHNTSQHEINKQQQSFMQNCMQKVISDSHQILEMSHAFCRNLEQSITPMESTAAGGGARNQAEGNGSFNAKAAK